MCTIGIELETYQWLVWDLEDIAFVSMTDDVYDTSA